MLSNKKLSQEQTFPKEFASLSFSDIVAQNQKHKDRFYLQYEFSNQDFSHKKITAILLY